MNRVYKNNKKRRFKLSKYKVLRNFTVIGIIGILFFCLKSSAYSSYNYKTIIISQGQTLWDIAQTEKASNEYYKNKDIRSIVKNIKDINNLSNSNIYPNQVLKVIEND